jgi:hypothetical protein
VSPRDQAALTLAVEDADPAAAYSREIAAIRAADASAEAARKAKLEECIAAVGAADWSRPAPAPRTPEAELRVQIGMAWLNSQRRFLG